MQTALDWLHVYPQGMEKLVTYFKDRYNNIPMYITENGQGQPFCKVPKDLWFLLSF